MNNKKMDKEVFWELITIQNERDQSYKKIDNHLSQLKNNLASFSDVEIIKFEKIFQTELFGLLHYNVLALYEALNPSSIMKKDGKVLKAMEGYVSKDGFIYFRCWLLLQGKKFIESLKENPENAIYFEFQRDFTNNWCEELINISEDVLKKRKSKIVINDQIPNEIHYDCGSYKFSGKEWSINEFKERFPVLVDEFDYERRVINMEDYET